ncbi:hypothetical protein A3J41_02280 [candidate division TM6 bacterium RIFCSPHIGHO2_12_FULL_38_8]|nr:MAG: hypothetical protein A3J41_02280 [candidate division TM6 bacterium RIFCSPHIGHO2_12_FULL_38_8]
MKPKLYPQKPQYIVDDQGKRKGVIFDIHHFEKFLEEVEDLYFGTLAEKEFNKYSKATMKHDDVKKLIKTAKRKN